MSDILFPLQIVNGDIAIVDDNDSLTSQLKSYLQTFKGETELEPNYGSSVYPQQATKQSQLIAELNRLEAIRYFSEIRIDGKNVTDRITFLQIYKS